MEMTEDQKVRYHAACHAMQSGVSYDHGGGSQDGSPKHLRVGVNCALVETSVLARLLVAKGIVTEHEYAEALIAGMEEEVRSYEKRLAERYGGASVKLS